MIIRIYFVHDIIIIMCIISYNQRLSYYAYATYHIFSFLSFFCKIYAYRPFSCAGKKTHTTHTPNSYLIFFHHVHTNFHIIKERNITIVKLDILVSYTWDLFDRLGTCLYDIQVIYHIKL